MNKKRRNEEEKKVKGGEKKTGLEMLLVVFSFKALSINCELCVN